MVEPAAQFKERKHRTPPTRAAMPPILSIVGTIVVGVGKTQSAPMPRFALSDADLTALIVYAFADPQRVPGATDTPLHFAMITTPKTDPAQRRDARRAGSVRQRDMSCRAD
jgi:hypothetical protein